MSPNQEKDVEKIQSLILGNTHYTILRIIFFSSQRILKPQDPIELLFLREAIRNMTEFWIIEKNSALSHLFVDCKAAYDSVNTDTAMEEFGFPSKVIVLTKLTLLNHISKGPQR